MPQLNEFSWLYSTIIFTFFLLASFFKFHYSFPKFSIFFNNKICFNFFKNFFF